MNIKELQLLTPIELLLLQKHVKLGKSHLKKWLTKEEITQLFQLAKIDDETMKKMGSSNREFIENLSLVVNTVFTGTLGAWMGISGLLKVSLDVPILFFSLLSFCALIGGFVGFHNYLFTKKIADQAIEQRKIKTTEVTILKVLNQHRMSEIQEKTKGLRELLKSMKIKGIKLLELSPQELNDHEVCLNWLNQIDLRGEDFQKNESVYEIFSAEIEKIKSSLRKCLASDQKRDGGKVVEILGKLSSSSIYSEPATDSWLKKNFRNIIISLAPVIFGGFGSLFVYFGGAPKIAKEMGKSNLFHFLDQPHIKYIELAIALGITAYFAFVCLHLNYKVFKRNQELAKMNVLLAREESELALLDDKFLKIKRIDEVMKSTNSFYCALKKLAQVELV